MYSASPKLLGSAFFFLQIAAFALKVDKKFLFYESISDTLQPRYNLKGAMLREYDS